jgi:hypothetical protein
MGSFLYPPPEPAAIVIYDDGGGIVEDYKAAVMRYASADRPVKVVGSCRSACTLVLAYSNVCVYPSAVFKWHMAYNSFNPDILYPEVTGEMIDWMPWSIQEKLRVSVRKEYNSAATMTGRQLISYGIKECK